MKFLKVICIVLTMCFTLSCGLQPKMPKIPGIEGPVFNILDGKTVLITMKLLFLNFDYGGKIPIPKTSNSYFEVTPNAEDGGSLVVFTVDINDLKDLNIGTGDPNTLPDGRPVPGFPGGTVNNSLRVDTEVLHTSFYYSPKIFGFYIPINWDTHGFAVSEKIIIGGKDRGVVGSVASDPQGHGAGFFLFLRLQSLQDKQVQKLLRLSSKNPNVIY